MDKTLYFFLARRVSKVMAKRFKKRSWTDSEDFSNNVVLIFNKIQSVPANTVAARASPARYAISPKHSPRLITAMFFEFFLTTALPLQMTPQLQIKDLLLKKGGLWYKLRSNEI